MAGRKLTVVISQSPGKNPVKRHLEEEIATRLMLSGMAEVSVVPHLYDLTPDHTGMLWLKSLKGNLVVLGWLYPRAIRWILDRNGVKGQVGESLLNVAETGDEEDDEEEHAAAKEADEAAPRGIGSLNVPNRQIFVIDSAETTRPRRRISPKSSGSRRRLSGTAARAIVGAEWTGWTIVAARVCRVRRWQTGRHPRNGFHESHGTNGSDGSRSFP